MWTIFDVFIEVVYSIVSGLCLGVLAMRQVGF